MNDDTDRRDADAAAADEVHSNAPALSWELVGQAKDHPRCGEVMAALASVKLRYPDAGHGDRYAIVVEAGDAEPVIEIQALGLDVFTEVVTTLRQLGLTDRLQGQDQASAAVHAAFH